MRMDAVVGRVYRRRRGVVAMSKSSRFVPVRPRTRAISRVGAGLALVISAGALAGIHTDAVAARPSGAAKAALVVGAERAASTARPANGQSAPAVAWNGQRYLVVWAEGSADGTSSIYAARVSPTGTVLDPNGILLGSGDAFETLSAPGVAGGAGKFLVMWEREPEGTYDDLDAAMVTNAGVVQRHWGLSFVDNQQSLPVAAWNGKLFQAVWEDQPDAVQEDIFGARVTRDAVTLDGCSSDSCPNGDDPGIAISVGPMDETAPAVAANDQYSVAVWTDANSATATDISASGVATNGDILAFGTKYTISGAAGAQSEASIARTGDTFLIAWTDRRSGSVPNIYSTLIRPGTESDFNATPLSPNGVAVSTAAGSQSAPSVARRGTGYVVAWTDTRNGGSDVFAARVNAAGVVVDQAGVPIAASARPESAPAAVAGSGNQLIAYQRPVPAAPFNGSQRVFFRLLN
jgi:large repetitive protein